MFAARTERYVGELKTNMGTETFDREWEAGSELGMPDAVERALGWVSGRAVSESAQP